MRYDFDTMMALQAKARRERSEAIFEMLILPLATQIKRLFTYKALRHAPRPHLARQG